MDTKVLKLSSPLFQSLTPVLRRTKSKPNVFPFFQSVYFQIILLSSKALQKAEYSDFLNFCKIQNKFFPHVFRYTEYCVKIEKSEFWENNQINKIYKKQTKNICFGVKNILFSIFGILR